MKRGQVTIFIIVGIIALIAVVLTVYTYREAVKDFYEEKFTRLSQVPAEFQPVEEHIEYCIQNTASTSLTLVYLQGGYFEPKNYITLEDTIDVSYWYDKKDISPSIGIIEQETVKAMSYLIEGCITDFEEDYDIEINEIIPSIHINDENVVASAKIDLDVTYKDLTFDFNKEYDTSFESEAKNMYDSTKPILKNQEKNPDDIPLTLLIETGYDVNFFNLDNTLVYFVTGDNIGLMFANRF